MSEILVSPETVSVIEGDTAVFHCIARADEIDIFVNGTGAENQHVVDKGFKESILTDISETLKERTLKTIAMRQYNNTNIICRASTIMDLLINNSVLSDIAVLHVQGN